MTNFVKFLEKITDIYTTLIMTNINLNKIIAPSSVGLFVVVVSGVCFYFWNSFRKGRGTTSGNNENNKLSLFLNDGRCACCLKPFIIIGQSAECNNCGGKFCKSSCGKRDTQDDNLLCLICHHQRLSLRNRKKWLDKFGPTDSSEIKSSNHSSTEKSRIIYAAGTEQAENSGGTDKDDEEKNSMENLRFIIEKFVEDLVGNVDNTPIDRLYNHPAYKQDTDTPSMAHTALRELVERAVDEARKLPGLGESVTTRTQETTTTTTSTLPINEQSYEELLASAILNKVIEKYQNDRVDDNGIVLEEKKSRYLRRNKSRESIDDVDDGNSEFELTSCDEYNSECSSTKTKHLRVHQDPLSLTIEEKIEEVTTTFTPNDDPRDIKSNILNFRNSRRVPFPEYGMDIIDPSQESSDDSQDETNELSSAPMEHITPVETWEENWLFQRKKIQTQSEPVSMLVPNPSADYRALIGDKDAEDTSDLSEFSAQSDEDEEINEQIIQAINQTLPAQSSKINQQLHCVNKKNELMIINDNFSSEILSDDQIKNNKINHYNQQLENNLIVTSTNIIDGDNLNSKINDNSVDSEDKIEKTVDNNFNLKVIKNNSVESDNEIEKKIIDNGLNSEIMLDGFSPSDDKIEKIVEEIIMKKNQVFNYFENKHDDIPIADEKIIYQTEKIQNKENNYDNSKDTLNLSEDFKSMDKKNTDDSTENLIIGETDIHFPNNNEMCQEIKSVSQVTEKKIIDDENLVLSAPPRPGTIAEREHRKWENAAPIQNNPYSPENIQKRLLERQYAKRSSDVSGNSNALTSSPSPPLQIVLGASRPDVKRFGRDYYINESKSPVIERVPRPGTSSSSRPASSLSLNSSSTSSDFEHQELYELIEVSNDSSVNQQNNCEIEQNEAINNNRKNSKNKINAKLNNHGLFDDKKLQNEQSNNKIKKISRIDLRAYGFENEIYKSNDDNIMEKKDKRVINKLDLRLYGYDSGIRRTQSNNHIDSNIKKRYLNRNSNNNKYNKITGKFDDYNWTQSTDDLNNDDNNNNNNEEFKKFGGMTGAMSVPNIAKTSTYDYNRNKSSSFDSEEEEEEDIQPLVVNNNNNNNNGTGINNDDIIKQIPSHYNYETDSQSSRTESTDDLAPKYTTLKNIKYSFESLSGEDTFGNKDYPMPSVRRLAQAFNKPPVPIPVATTRMIRFNGTRDRPTTPDIHIVKTPRQMHSLTARSISREFREELRNISTKQSTPTWNTVIIEQSKTPAGSSENESGDDLCVIEAGKLKNNIKFWEEIQQKS